MPDFLLEIGCEEIPARMIDAGAEGLRERVAKMLERERLEPSGAVTSFDTPRRLAILAAGVPSSQPDVTEQITGPSLAIAYKDGQPTPAAHAFAKKAGVEVSQLEKTSRRRAIMFPPRVTKKGRCTSEIWLSCSPRKSRRYTGRRICTGARRTSASCGRSAGWLPCSTGK